MPLKRGKSRKVISENIAEFHKGPSYEHTRAKFGKARADAQAVAVAMREAGVARKRKRMRRRKHRSDTMPDHMGYY